MRINKFLAECGLGSRRSCETLITEGKVRLNGKTAGLGEDVDPERDVVTVSGRRVTPPRKYTYLMFHKPKGCVTTASDDLGRKTVMDYIDLTHVRVYPVGRLDYDTEGLLLLTNDGDLAQTLTHPSHHIGKTYAVRVAGRVEPAQLEALREGVRLDDGDLTAPAEVTVLEEGTDSTRLEITIYEGKNRQIRRMLEAVGKKVTFLKRTGLGDLRLGGLPRGKYRYLNPKEIEALKKLGEE